MNARRNHPADEGCGRSRERAAEGPVPALRALTPGRCGTPWDDATEPDFVTALTSRYATPMDKGVARGIEFAKLRCAARQSSPGRRSAAVPSGQQVRRSAGL
jgi:hypothetical protein